MATTIITTVDMEDPGAASGLADPAVLLREWGREAGEEVEVVDGEATAVAVEVEVVTWEEEEPPYEATV